MNKIHLSFQKLSNGNYFSYIRIDRLYLRTGCMDVCMDSGDILYPCIKIGGGIKIFT